MKIGVIFDGLSALGPTPDVLILDALEAIEGALDIDGNVIVRVPVNPDGRWVERVRRAKFDLIVNLCEGVDGVAALEPSVIGVLELLGVPFTGSSSWTTSLCLRKHVVNRVLEHAGVPVPPFAAVRPGEPMPSVGFPAICKPAAEDASIGVEQRSVVRSARALSSRVNAMHARWDEIVVQRYVDGREVNVGIVGDRVLPIAEIDFSRMPGSLWRIVSYRSKWHDGSDEDLGAKPHCPADLPDGMTETLSRIALDAWNAVGGEGYGRVDMRIDAEGRPWVLEVNSNPDLSPDAGLARMAGVAGLDYAALLHAICDAAISKPRTSTLERWALAQRLSGVAAPAAATGDAAWTAELAAAGRH